MPSRAIFSALISHLISHIAAHIDSSSRALHCAAFNDAQMKQCPPSRRQQDRANNDAMAYIHMARVITGATGAKGARCGAILKSD